MAVVKGPVLEGQSQLTSGMRIWLLGAFLNGREESERRTLAAYMQNVSTSFSSPTVWSKSRERVLDDYKLVIDGTWVAGSVH